MIMFMILRWVPVSIATYGQLDEIRLDPISWTGREQEAGREVAGMISSLDGLVGRNEGVACERAKFEVH